MKFRPLHDRVVVKRIDAEEKTAGGIIIPDSAKEKPSQGEITAVGPGGRDESGKLIPIDLKVGDRVLFGSDFPTIPYPYLEQLEGLGRVSERHPELGEDWLRRVCWSSAARLFGSLE